MVSPRTSPASGDNDHLHSDTKLLIAPIGRYTHPAKYLIGLAHRMKEPEPLPDLVGSVLSVLLIGRLFSREVEAFTTRIKPNASSLGNAQQANVIPRNSQLTRTPVGHLCVCTALARKCRRQAGQDSHVQRLDCASVRLDGR